MTLSETDQDVVSRSQSPDESENEDSAGDMGDDLQASGDKNGQHGTGGTGGSGAGASAMKRTAANAKDPFRPRRKKARRACFACQRAHLTCGT